MTLGSRSGCREATPGKAKAVRAGPAEHLRPLAHVPQSAGSGDLPKAAEAYGGGEAERIRCLGREADDLVAQVGWSGARVAEGEDGLAELGYGGVEV